MADLELGGYRVKPGLYGPDEPVGEPPRPGVFSLPAGIPSRTVAEWAGETLPKFAYYPFGGGQRICVGSTFALMEATIILATVGQHYQFTVDPDAVIDIKPQITLLPANGIPTALECRSPYRALRLFRLQRYRFTLDPDVVIEIKPQITLLPANGMPATLQRR